jgi:hypothetical protein
MLRAKTVMTGKLDTPKHRFHGRIVVPHRVPTVPDPDVIAAHDRKARGLLVRLRLELDELLVPVWGLLAAPTVSREGRSDELRYDLRLLDWLVRLECAATAYPSTFPSC